MENVESILDELNEYNKKQAVGEIPQPLEEYITHLAKTGETIFPWSKIRPVLRHKLELVIADFREVCPTESLPPCPNVEPFHYDTMRDKIFEQFDSFNCAPFTIQRLCELVCAPRKHYKRTDKFMRGIEKNLLVVSTVDPDQRKRSETSSQTLLVNGVVDSGTSRAIPSFSDNKEHRPASAASDVASVSDADSGISDTEDEEKPAARKVEPADEGKKEEENGAEDKLQADSCKNIDVESLATEEKPTEEDSISEEPESPVQCDKKRPLEKTESDKHSPDAKQPRIASPDKVIDDNNPAVEESVPEEEVGRVVVEEPIAVVEEEESKAAEDKPVVTETMTTSKEEEPR